jgi:hypothetical protein
VACVSTLMPHFDAWPQCALASIPGIISWTPLFVPMRKCDAVPSRIIDAPKLSRGFIQRFPDHGDLCMIKSSGWLARARCIPIARLMRRYCPGQAACTKPQFFDDFPLTFCTPVRRMAPPARSEARMAMARCTWRFRPSVSRSVDADLLPRCGSLIVLLIFSGCSDFVLLPFSPSFCSTCFWASGAGGNSYLVGLRRRHCGRR